MLQGNGHRLHECGLKPSQPGLKLSRPTHQVCRTILMPQQVPLM